MRAGGVDEAAPEIVVLVEAGEGINEHIHHLGREAVVLGGPVDLHREDPAVDHVDVDGSEPRVGHDGSS